MGRELELSRRHAFSGGEELLMSRKWVLAVATWILCAVVVLVGTVRWIFDPTSAGATTLIAQGLSGIGAVIALYGAANVAQKGVIGKNYRAELDEGRGL